VSTQQHLNKEPEVRRISTFWINVAAGVPLGPAWKRKDAQIELELEHEAAIAEAMPLNVWANRPQVERQAVERVLYGEGVLTVDRWAAGERAQLLHVERGRERGR